MLGLNKRNGDYILRFNPRRLYPLVDDKLKTKRLALQAGIAVPELYGVIETQHDIRTLPRHRARATPSSRSSRRTAAPATASSSSPDAAATAIARSAATLLDEDFLSHHLSNAINGQFSLGGVQDVVIVEYMVRFSPLFERISYQGVPDIRVIVFRGYPVMAMVRLPTRASHGKANLHQGAVGAGIDLATGITLDGVIGTEVVTHHPDTTHAIAGLQRAGLGHDPRHLGALLRADRPRLHRRRHRARSRSRAAGAGAERAAGPGDPDRQPSGTAAPSEDLRRARRLQRARPRNA